MAGVTGIGGFFFRANDIEALKAWHVTHLGVSFEPGGWSQAAGPTQMAAFAFDDAYFPEDRKWMINFRVDDLGALKAQLEAADIMVETKKDWDGVIGRFARIHDPEGNPIELWEPSQMVRDHYGL
ncbi:MAG: VOC family protein [Pseudomonadota bacterium]